MADNKHDTFRLDLITPEKNLFSGDVAMVEAPGTLGDFGVLPGHAPFVSTLRPGTITIEESGHAKRKIAVLSGIAEVAPDHCRLLVEVARDFSDLSPADIHAHLEKMRKQAATAIGDTQRRRAVQEVALAEAMLETTA